MDMEVSPLDQAPEPPTGRRERNKRDKLRRILAAATRLFNEKGFEQTTTQAIADAADIGTGTLFLYAKTKEDLLIMVFQDEMIAESRAAVRALSPEAPLIEQLMSVFEVMIAYHARDIELARVLIKEISIPSSARTHPYIHTLMKEIYSGLGAIVATGQKQGRLRADIDPIVAGEAIFGAYYIGLIAWLAGMTPRPLFVTRLRKRLIVLLSGLETR